MKKFIRLLPVILLALAFTSVSFAQTVAGNTADNQGTVENVKPAHKAKKQKPKKHKKQKKNKKTEQPQKQK